MGSPGGYIELAPLSQAFVVRLLWTPQMTGCETEGLRALADRRAKACMERVDLAPSWLAVKM